MNTKGEQDLIDVARVEGAGLAPHLCTTRKAQKRSTAAPSDEEGAPDD